ncbi:MAG: RimK family protein [Cytophagaceae bacterium]|jgi:glutathione synthase/RimK-type ligase-like ATP-grasp enzyme|nr:RimK family protein [Cytophagaceae bacterium]
MSSVVLLLDDLNDWKSYYETSSIMSVSDYLQNKSPHNEIKTVINLSNDYSYNSEGYYCSLLAQARGHKVVPGVDIINKLETGTGIRMSTSLQKLCYQWIQKNCISDEIWYINIYFGTCVEQGLEKIARFIFDNYPCPLLRVGFNTRQRNQIETVQYLRLNSLNDIEQSYFAEALDSFNKKVWRNPRAQKSLRYSLAIYHDPEEKLPPSDKKALQKFLEAARKNNIHAELITEDDAARLIEFDALFIRATTSLNHITFHLSQKAKQNELVVIDDPVSIIRCTNKVYLNELLEKERIAAPRSMLVFRSNNNSFASIEEQLGSPFILKIPDGSFSHGMQKISNPADLEQAFAILFDKSAILLAQEFIPTEFDWRIGILNGEPLYACKYFMAKGHWQIYNHSHKGKNRVGLVETIPIYKVPPQVLKIALKATSLIGKGLYGVDIKMIGERAIIIEINDNPSLDHEIEDAILGDELYFKIINYFVKTLDAKHH